MTENKISNEDTVNDIIRLYPNTIAIFNDFKIDSCCGGAASLSDAAARDGADLNALLIQLNEAADENN